MEKEPRIISLLPNATEIIFATGLGKYLVGRSHECKYPEPAQSLPACTETGIKTTSSLEEINQNVQELLKKATSVFKVDIEKIRELQPTHIITQSQCEICSIQTSELENLIGEYLQNENVKIIDVSPQTLDQALADFVKIPNAIGFFNNGFMLRVKIANEIQSIRTKCTQFIPKPKAAVLEWINPMMTAGLWVNDLIEAAAGIPAFANKQTLQIDFNALEKANPDYIIFAPCGFDIQKTKSELDVLFSDKQFNELRAFKKKNIFIANGSSFFNNPGPRLLESLEILTEILHPEDFKIKHQGDHWINYFNE